MMELKELTNILWDKYKEGHFEEVFIETKKWFNRKTRVKYDELIFLIAISNVSNSKISARLFWKHFVYGHRYDIFGNSIYKNIRKEFSSRWEELIYDDYKDVKKFWGELYEELRWKKPYKKQENIWIHVKGHKWSKYYGFIGDLDKAKFNEHYGHIQYYIEDFEDDERYKDGSFTYESSAQYFAKECLVYHLRNTFDQTINEFIDNGRIELFKGKWISEFNLYLKVKEAFKGYNIIQQGSPSFLESQRFDIWIPELKVAIEYNGLQHYEAVDFFGGEEGLQDTIKRDKLKRKKCLENNIKMIEVVEGYDINILINEIRQFD